VSPPSSELHVRVDRSACRGAGSCARRAPGTFSLDAEHRSVVAAHPRDPADAIRAAAQACPFFAIEVGDAPGKGDPSG
jgi:ferredoxin